MDNREEFAQWLDDKLHQKGLKRAEFARLTGISAPQITRILKREQRAGPGSIKAIAKFLEVDEESLYKLAGYRTVRIKKIDEEVIALYDKIMELPSQQRHTLADFVDYLYERHINKKT